MSQAQLIPETGRVVQTRVKALLGGLHVKKRSRCGTDSPLIGSDKHGHCQEPMEVMKLLMLIYILMKLFKPKLLKRKMYLYVMYLM